LAAGALVSGCSNQIDARELGHAAVSVSALTFPSSITSIGLEAQPANVTRDLTYDASNATFSGSIMLPAGNQTLTARAYMGNKLAGQGTATVTIAAGQTAGVVMRILDTSAPDPMVDVPPAITTVTASTIQPAIGEAVTMSVSAADANGDPLSYAWSSNCTIGSFSTTSSAQTTWMSTAAGVCTITITVTANGKSAAQQVDITALDTGTGAASINGTYVRAPDINSVSASASGFSCSPWRMEPMCSNSLPPGQTLSVTAFFSLGELPLTDGGTTGAVQVKLTDNCGGTTENARTDINVQTGLARMTWTPPTSQAVCTLTFSVMQETMVGQFSFVVLVK
jgi:hypothetical protein